MDYPPPRALLLNSTSGTVSLDISHAYASGAGELDKLLIQWGYGSDEARNQVFAQRTALGIRLLQDQDADAGVNPEAARWDDGNNQVEALKQAMLVRAYALDRLSFYSTLSAGEPLSELGRLLPPIFLWHRYQIEAVAHYIGGANYSHQVREPVLSPPSGFYSYRPLNKELQDAALSVLLFDVLSLNGLAFPQQLLLDTGLLPPAPTYYPLYPDDMFHSTAGLAFDIYQPTEVVCFLVLHQLLDAARLVRLYQYHQIDHNLYPDVFWLLDQIDAAVLPCSDPTTPCRSDYTNNLTTYQRGLAQTRLVVYLDLLVDLLDARSMLSPRIFTQLMFHVEEAILPKLMQFMSEDPSDTALLSLYARHLEWHAYQTDLLDADAHSSIIPPAGQPIRKATSTSRSHGQPRSSARLQLLRDFLEQ